MKDGHSAQERKTLGVGSTAWDGHTQLDATFTDDDGGDSVDDD